MHGVSVDHFVFEYSAPVVIKVQQSEIVWIVLVGDEAKLIDSRETFDTVLVVRDNLVRGIWASYKPELQSSLLDNSHQGFMAKSLLNNGNSVNRSVFASLVAVNFLLKDRALSIQINAAHVQIRLSLDETFSCTTEGMVVEWFSSVEVFPYLNSEINFIFTSLEEYVKTAIIRKLYWLDAPCWVTVLQF